MNGRLEAESTQLLLFRSYRFPPEIISSAVWLSHRCCLSLQDVEELVAERNASVSDEAVRQLCLKLGPSLTIKLRPDRYEVRGA